MSEKDGLKALIFSDTIKYKQVCGSETLSIKTHADPKTGNQVDNYISLVTNISKFR